MRSILAPSEQGRKPLHLHTPSDCRKLAAVFRLIGRAAIICALCLSLGFQWVALQSVAWGAMIVQYSHHVSLAQAVAQTFDGQHPCNLCKGITSAQHSEKKNDAQPVTLKPDLICATRTITLLPRWTDFAFPALEMHAVMRAKSPPTPPPRSELA